VSLPFDQIEQVFGAKGPKIICEVGAADGTDTLAYAQRYAGCAIHAFEPLDYNIAALRKTTVSVSQRVESYEISLSDSAGTADFWVSGGLPPGLTPSGPTGWRYSSSLLPPREHTRVHPWCVFKKTLIETARLDSFSIPHIDYMHIDVQGAELKVLVGAGRLLNSVQAIWLEVSTIEMYENQPLYNDISSFMLQNGFKLILDTASGRYAGDQFWRRH
jgi:FkbM family methyltransferase